jgi:hypothetical protein
MDDGFGSELPHARTIKEARTHYAEAMPAMLYHNSTDEFSTTKLKSDELNPTVMTIVPCHRNRTFRQRNENYSSD